MPSYQTPVIIRNVFWLIRYTEPEETEHTVNLMESGYQVLHSEGPKLLQTMRKNKRMRIIQIGLKWNVGLVLQNVVTD
jgi:hypothetical protein